MPIPISRWEPHSRPIQRLLVYLDVTLGSWNRYRQIDLELQDYTKPETHAARESLVREFLEIRSLLCPREYVSMGNCVQELFDDSLAEAHHVKWKPGYDATFQMVAQQISLAHSPGLPARLSLDPHTFNLETERRWKSQGDGLCLLRQHRSELLNIMSQNGEKLPKEIRIGRLRIASLSLTNAGEMEELTHNRLVGWIREAREEPTMPLGESEVIQKESEDYYKQRAVLMKTAEGQLQLFLRDFRTQSSMTTRFLIGSPNGWDVQKSCDGWWAEACAIRNLFAIGVLPPLPRLPEAFANQSHVQNALDDLDRWAESAVFLRPAPAAGPPPAAPNEAVPAEPLSVEELKAKVAHLPKHVGAAYLQFHAACFSIGDGTDRAAYDAIPDSCKDGEKLPSFETWSKHLRLARKAFGEQKYGKRKAAGQKRRNGIPLLTSDSTATG